MRVTAIEPRRKRLRALFLDGAFAANVDEETLLSSPYRVGSEMSEEEYQALLSASEKHRAREKALYLLSHRDHSQKELEEKLRRATNEETARETAQRMSELGLVDDAGYARRYARELMGRRGFSASRTEYELLQKGIDRELIHEIIEEIAPEPAEQLRKLLEGKFSRSPQDEKGRRRTVAALQRLGYRWEEIRPAMDQYFAQGEDEDEL
jgi:regulatory protein